MERYGNYGSSQNRPLDAAQMLPVFCARACDGDFIETTLAEIIVHDPIEALCPGPWPEVVVDKQLRVSPLSWFMPRRARR